MESVFDSKGKPLKLEKIITQAGGEGVIWETDRGDLVAKIYKPRAMKETEEILRKRSKLNAMIASPPHNPTETQGHTSIAWPLDVLTNTSHEFCGFLMPRIQGVNLIHVYNPKLRQKTLNDFNWQYLHVAAQNLAWIIQLIHDKGYVIGDIKPENILVNNRALISIVDTDSFQVTDPVGGMVHLCPVGSIGLTPPELLGVDLGKVVQNHGHDNFRLAIIIYKLLLGGEPPYSGRWQGTSDPPASEDEFIKRKLWPYSGDNLIAPSARTIPLTIVHPVLKELFLKCFNEGHSTPSERPSAKAWYNALTIARQDLVQCTQKKNHYYGKIYGQSYSRCYWCHRSSSLSVDIFPDQPRPQPQPVTPDKTPSGNIKSSDVSGLSKRKGCLVAIAAGAVLFFIVLVLAAYS